MGRGAARPRRNAQEFYASAAKASSVAAAALGWRGAALPPQGLATRPGRVAAEPGTSAGCWDNEFTYTRCCLAADQNCWFTIEGDGTVVGFSGFSRDVCCSAFLEAAQAEHQAEKGPTFRSTEVSPTAPAELSRCLRRNPTNISLADVGAPNQQLEQNVRQPMTIYSDMFKQFGWSYASPDSLCQNPFVKVAECVARQSDVDVVLDLFLGGGCTAAAFAHGLGAARRGGPVLGAQASLRYRPPEVFSFELNESVLQATFAPNSRIQAGRQLGLWRSTLVPMETRTDLMRFQEVLLDLPAGDSVAVDDAAEVSVFVLAGEPFPIRRESASWDGYRWNALDVLCQGRAPLDVVLIDLAEGGISLEAVWSIIETVCLPKWVLLINLNIHSEASWIFHRLLMLPSWRLELRGHF
eukprot:CAMPEP_0117534460 /NCGR_PEP_ID=MMETSP0784-20121206/40423_1 /TAXON_ID=39447 /ORGANISM="" /LENGTH=409 /DNA_ID=CAMNT_0005330941 /DNA_START=51 /DNA_END=1277 /DNA_ORIENTATION=-